MQKYQNVLCNTVFEAWKNRYLGIVFVACVQRLEMICLAFESSQHHVLFY